MTRLIKKHSKKIGMPPGTLIHVGEKKTERVTIDFIDYDEEHFEGKTELTVNSVLKLKDTPTVSWINIIGLHDISIIEHLGNHFDIHPLVLEDILNTGQRPKVEDFERYIFIILKMLRYDDKKDEIINEQVSLILTQNCVISFQEIKGDIFDSIRERIRSGKGRIRKRGTDYLTYTLIDAIVDHYFIILEKLGEKIEEVEEDLLSNPHTEIIQKIHQLKQEMLSLKKSIWPLREVISNFQKNESSLIQNSTDIFLRDVYDHTIQVIDTIETYRDILSGLLDIYMSSLSNKMNEVMKVLTIFAAIFIPLTFIAGVYGMNFAYMPELSQPWGYPVVLLVFVVVSAVLLFYFKHKRWL